MLGVLCLTLVLLIVSALNKIQIHPDVPRVRRVAYGKKRTVPNQAMSLREMLRRFVRREPLPVEKQGVYIESDYDLEKLPHLDRTEQDEILAEMKGKTEKAKAKVEKKKKEDADKVIAEEVAKQKAEAAKQQSDPKAGESK